MCCSPKRADSSRDLVIGADSHTCTYGALSEHGDGSTDIAASWVLGETWLRVPESILSSMRKKGNRLSPKDLILFTIGKLG